MTTTEPTRPDSARTTIRRLPSRGVYDRAQIHRIVDEALICHVGIIDDGRPYVIPTIHVRIDDTLYLHGSRASRLLSIAGSGAPVCVTITLLDGLVLARSAFHHSMNYRSVVVLGKGRIVEDAGEKRRALDALVEQVVPGRSAEARGASSSESAATQVVAIEIDEASAKVRTGPPTDEDADYALPVWAGVLPTPLTCGEPEPDPKLAPGIVVPEYVSCYRRPS